MSGARLGLTAEDDLPYSRAAYVRDDAIPQWQALHTKTAAVQLVRELYKRKEWKFTNWHAALFYMFSEQDLARCLEDPQAARYYGDGAELFATILVPGRVPSGYEPAAAPAPAATTTDNLTPTADPSAAVPSPSNAPHAGGGSLGSLKRTLSLGEAAGSLRKKAVRRAGKLTELFKPSSRSDEAGTSTSAKTD